MKLGVLTHPLYGNYGGMLQAYAMVKILQHCGHEAYNLDYEPRSYRKILHDPIKRMKERFRIQLLRCSWLRPVFKTPTILQIAIGQDFEKKYVPHLWIGDNPAARLKEHAIEAVVVGSDQVWRGAYASPMMSLPFFFLDFASQQVRNNSIAYAASFGTDTWEGDQQETVKCQQLVSEFRAVSVREASGVSLCKQTFNTDSVRVADPTLLLHADDYSTLIEHEETWIPENPYIATYILDHSAPIRDAISATAQSKQHAVQALKADSSAPAIRDRLPISVTQWLRLIRDSECLITDSFHGCVFAIIFNKPFVCLGNKKRGIARFESLLSTYGLKERIVTEISDSAIQRVLSTPVDWEYVNTVHSNERETALQFLHSNLD